MSCDAGAHYEMGHLLEAKGDLDSALAEYRQALELSPGIDEEAIRCMVLKEAHRKILSIYLRKRNLIGASSEWIVSMSTTPGKRLLIQYCLLLLAVSALAWSLGVPIQDHPAKYLPRILVLPLAIMLLSYCYHRFLRERQ